MWVQSAGLLLADGNGRSIKAGSIPPGARKAYSEYYCQIDYVLDAVEKGPVGLIRSAEPLIALKARSEFDADWMRPHHMDGGLSVWLTDGSTPTCFLVAAPKRSEALDTAERVKLMSALVPHLQQALRTQDHLTDCAQGASDIDRALDSVRHGIAVVEAGSAVIHVNAATERILKCRDGLRISSGSLEATCASANAELGRSIAGALFEQECGPRRGNSFLCRRPSGKRPYVVHVLPFNSAAGHPSAARALVVLVDPEQQSEPSGSLLRRVYGLTHAEADVALRVLRGDGLKPISEQLSVCRWPQLRLTCNIPSTRPTHIGKQNWCACC